ncbi:MAG: tetratricopeptide repeat protein [Fimbriimonadaceae bacterium]
MRLHPLCIAPLAIAVLGCSGPVAQLSSQQEPGAASAMPAVDAKHKLSQERTARAMKGLAVRDGILVVTRPAPGNAATLLAQAEATLKSNSWFESCEAYGKALAAAPRSAAAYEGFAASAMLDLKSDLAMAALRSAIALDPDRLSSRYRLAEIHQMDGNYGLAREEWGRVSQSDVRFQDVEARLAIASFYDNDLAATRAHLARAKSLGQAVPPQFEALVASQTEGRP